MKALVLANGELSKTDVLRRRIHSQAFELVVAADAGVRHAHSLNVKVDIIIGDMDSISQSERENTAGVELIYHPAEKDETDLELALFQAKNLGADSIVVAGAMGGRMDMTVANILLMAHSGLGSCRVEVWQGDQTGWLIRPPGGEITGQPGDTVSLIPLTGEASGISTQGLKHSLSDAKLVFGAARGISNVLESPASVRLDSGLLLVVHTPGKA